MKENKGIVLVAGSLVFDTIMNFSGRFSDYLRNKNIHNFNISFELNKIDTNFGGTAGNIAYNLALLKQSSQILTVVGTDFFSYNKKLKKLGINLTAVKKSFNSNASAYIITDRKGKQISGFFPGSNDLPLFNKILTKKIILAIISPDQKKRMLATWQWSNNNKIPYIFDPGQQVINFTAKELLKIISQSQLLIVNDFEVKIICKKLKKSLRKIMPQNIPLIVTKGVKGSDIFLNNKKILIPIVRPNINADPTGAGDAYRAGLIKGIINKLSLEKSAKLGATIAAYSVENRGAQNYKFNLLSVKKRFYKNFKEKLF